MQKPQNRYADIINGSEKTPSPDSPPEDNIYARIVSGAESNVAGSAFRATPPTNFSRIQNAKAASTGATSDASTADSLGSLAKETIKGVPYSAFQIAKSVVKDPVETARQAALGFANGVTMGGTDYLQRQAFLNEATKGNIKPDEAKAIADKVLFPQDPTLAGIRSGSDFAGMVVPYAATEGALTAGMKYAAPEFIANYSRAASLLKNIGVFSIPGQVSQSFVDPEKRDRVKQFATDAAMAVGFEGAGYAFRALRGTPFKSPFETAAVTNPNSLVGPAEVVTADALRKGAEARIAELSAKQLPRSSDVETLNFLKKNIDNPDALYTYNSNLPKADLPVPDAKVSTTIKTGEIDAKTGEATGPKVTVATNDLPALQDYIKGSGDINYKIVDSLGKDAKGNEIQARHEFNADTGVHTIYATDATTASSLAHELGHYFDTKLTGTVEKLSSLIPNFAKNQQKIEDLLASTALDRLGGNALSKDISKEVSTMVKELQIEIDTLSSTRRGSLIASKSERFADAISQVATEAGASEKAPILSSLLKQSERFNQQKLFGEGVIRDVALTSDVAKDNIVTVKGKDFTMSGKAAQEVKVATEDYRAKVKASNGVETVVAKKEFQAAKEKIVKEAAPGEAKPVKVKTVEKAKTLDRGETGKKPSTEAFKADKITSDAETEAFINTKFLSKVTGKERIGRSNEDIKISALSSKMTEEDLNKILTERFGNMSGDIVKAKQILTDGANNLRNKLAGRSIEDLSGQEMKDAMSDYNRLVQTFEVFAGVRTELSNSFRSLGIGVNPGENDVLASALEVIQKSLGGETNPFKLAQKAVALQEKGPVAKYFELWYPALLSGPKTSVRNIVGNVSNITAQIVARAFTTTGRRELMPMIDAIISGQKKAINSAISVMKGETTLLSKLHELPIPSGPTFKGKYAFLNKVELVGKFYNAQDAYFVSIAKDAEVAALRVGDYSYGLENKEIIDSVNEAISSSFSKMATYRNQLDTTFMGEAASKFSQLKSSDNQVMKFFANQFTPFIKTAANVTDRRIDFVPILNIGRTFFSREMYSKQAQRIVKEAGVFEKIFQDSIGKDMSASEARSFAQSESSRVQQIVIDRLRNQQMGRFYMGATVMAAGIPLAISGRITGSGPKNKNDRDTLIASGWRPNSIIMPNGIALPYQNLLAPMASILSVLGNISDAYKFNDTGSDGKNVAEAFKGYMRSELDQSFLSGISDIVNGITGYTPFEQVLSKLAANAIPIPAIWTQTNNIIFPEQYDARTFNENIRAKLGITGDFFGTLKPLQPRVNAFGDQVKADLVYGLTPPLLNSKTDDPVLNFLVADGLGVSKPTLANKVHGRKGEQRAMTPEEYTNFVKETGSQIHDELSNKIDSGFFDRFKTKDEKQKAVDAIVKAIRAREKLKIKYNPE